MARGMAGYFETLAWPSAADTLLVRACLADDAALAADWRDSAETGLSRLSRPGARLSWLLPLVNDYFSHRPLPSSVRVKLRAAALHEERRSATFDAITAVLLERLERAEPLLSRGQALALHGYPRSGLRHRHDFDLLVAPDRMDAAVAALIGGGCSDAGGLRLRHPSGLIVALHERPLPFDDPALSLSEMLRRSTPALAGRLTYRRPAPDQLLVHVLLLAGATPAATPLAWAADAWFAMADPHLDWDRVAAVDGPACAALLRGLAWLQAGVGAPVPVAVLARLRERVAALSPVDVETALFRVRRQVGRRVMLRHGRGADAPTLLKWLLAPSALGEPEASGRISQPGAPAGAASRRPAGRP